MMKQHLIFLSVLCSCMSVGFTQTGSLQIYCEPEVNIYIDNRYVGRTSTDMSGLFLDDVPVGNRSVRTYKSGWESQTAVVNITENRTTEVMFDLQKKTFKRETTFGLMSHFGTFGLFNVDNDFTKADYSLGFTPFIDVKIHPYFALGFEVMSMWGKPLTQDGLRHMLCPNLRLHFLFNPFEKVHVDVLIASGFSYWPASTNHPYLTATFNDARFGWDFRAMAGVDIVLSKSAFLNVNFGYWAASSTSDDVVWITHDTMLLSLGPKWKF